MAHISNTDLHRLRVWLEGMRAMAPAEHRASFAQILARDIFSRPEVFEDAIAREENLRMGIDILLRTADARAALADSYDALRRLVRGRSAAAAPSPAGPTGQPDQKKALLAYVLREEPRVDQRIREETFLQRAEEELSDGDRIWLRTQLMIQGHLRLAAMVAFLNLHPSGEGEEVAFATLRAAAAATHDVGQLADLYLAVMMSVLRRAGGGGARLRHRLRAAFPEFVGRMEEAVAGQAEIPLADRHPLARFYGNVGGLLQFVFEEEGPGGRMTDGDIALMEMAMGRAADIFAGIEDHLMVADISNNLARTVSPINSKKAAAYYERAAGAYDRWLSLHPEDPTGDLRNWESLSRNEAVLWHGGRPTEIDSRSALFRRAEALLSALQIAQLDGEEGEFRRLQAMYDAALSDLGRRVGRAMRNLALQELGAFLSLPLREGDRLEATYDDRIRRFISPSRPMRDLLALYQEILSADWVERSPTLLLPLSNLIGLALREGDVDAMRTAVSLADIFAPPVNPGRTEAFARIVFTMPQEDRGGMWRVHAAPPEMVAAARGEGTASFWNGIFDLVHGVETRLLGRNLGRFAHELDGAIDPARGRTLMNRLVAVSLRHAAGDFEFRRILIWVLAAIPPWITGSRDDSGEANASLLEPLERIAGLLGNPATYEEGLRAGAEYAGVKYRGRPPGGGTPSSGSAGGGSGPAGSGAGGGRPGGRRGAKLVVGRTGPVLSFGGITDGTVDATPAPAGDADAVDTTAAGAELYLGAEGTTLPLAPTIAPGGALVR